MRQKELYLSPGTEVMELKLEGVIATSVELTAVDDPFDDFETELEW
jgi:hypothetical protein